MLRILFILLALTSLISGLSVNGLARKKLRPLPQLRWDTIEDNRQSHIRLPTQDTPYDQSPAMESSLNTNSRRGYYQTPPYYNYNTQYYAPEVYTDYANDYYGGYPTYGQGPGYGYGYSPAYGNYGLSGVGGVLY